MEKRRFFERFWFIWEEIIWNKNRKVSGEKWKYERFFIVFWNCLFFLIMYLVYLNGVDIGMGLLCLVV